MTAAATCSAAAKSAAGVSAADTGASDPASLGRTYGTYAITVRGIAAQTGAAALVPPLTQWAQALSAQGASLLDGSAGIADASATTSASAGAYAAVVRQCG